MPEDIAVIFFTSISWKPVQKIEELVNGHTVIVLCHSRSSSMLLCWTAPLLLLCANVQVTWEHRDLSAGWSPFLPSTNTWSVKKLEEHLKEGGSEKPASSMLQIVLQTLLLFFKLSLVLENLGWSLRLYINTHQRALLCQFSLVMPLRESGSMLECTALVISNWQLSGCSTTGLVIDNMKDGSFRGHTGSYNSFIGRECVPTNTSRDVCHSNCGETTLKNTRYKEHKVF